MHWIVFVAPVTDRCDREVADGQGRLCEGEMKCPGISHRDAAGHRCQCICGLDGGEGGKKEREGRDDPPCQPLAVKDVIDNASKIATWRNKNMRVLQIGPKRNCSGQPVFGPIADNEKAS